MHLCFLLLSRAEHVAIVAAATAAAEYLYVYFVGEDDSNSRNKVLEASHGRWMHMHWNMRCSGKPWAEATIFGTMRPKVYFSHRSASHSPHTLADCLLLWLSQSKYSLFFSAAFTHWKNSHCIFSSVFNIIKSQLKPLALLSQNLPKDRAVGPLSAAGFSFLLKLTHSCKFHE